MADVDARTLKALNAGEVEAATLAEILSVDFAKLCRVVSPEAARNLPRTLAGGEGGLGITKRMEMVAHALLDAHGHDAIDMCIAHPSDSVRGWACYAIGAADGLTLRKRLSLIKPLADDPNSGVREWAWIGLRPRIAASLDESLDLLLPWTASKSPSIRRYASEITRPRGVWCAHLDTLKRNPAPGLPILQPLNADPTKYVQDSVANWLNDASKSNPEWVRTVCAAWLKQSPTRQTERICRRAMRTIEA